MPKIVTMANGHEKFFITNNSFYKSVIMIYFQTKADSRQEMIKL